MMEAYKFNTVVKKRGIIQIPEIAPLENQNIEVFIVVKSKKTSDKSKRNALNRFLEEWTGVIEGADPEALKAQYIEEKYG